ncbi:MAG: alpha/beta hydrolase [Pseudomonadota bacterium]
MDTASYGDPDTFIKLRDCSLPYWKIGRGPALVFVHGWPLDSRTWRESVAALKDSFTCHLIDLPRSGRSEWRDDTRIGVRAYGDILFEAVRQMDLDDRPFGLVGQNTGGSYARLAAARVPERITGLVLGNTEAPHRHSLFLRALFLLGKAPGLETILRTTLRMRLGRSSLLLMAGRHREHLHGPFTDLFIRPLVEDHARLKGAADILRAIRVTDFDILREAHGKIAAPVRLVWGPSDVWFTKRAAEQMLAEFAGQARLVPLHPGRLMIHEEHPHRFAEEVRDHFQTRDAGAASECKSTQDLGTQAERS